MPGVVGLHVVWPDQVVQGEERRHKQPIRVQGLLYAKLPADGPSVAESAQPMFSPDPACCCDARRLARNRLPELAFGKKSYTLGTNIVELLTDAG
jgi:hypothetical protein